MRNSFNEHAQVKKKVLVIDVAQSSNSGDDIMQRSLINLCREFLSENISLMSYFGPNEFDKLSSEFRSYYQDYGIITTSGVAFTYYVSCSQSRAKVILLRLLSLANMYGFLCAHLFGLSWAYSLVFLTREQRDRVSLIMSADLIIWNGRNFRGNPNSRFAEFVRISELCINPLICLRMRKPIINFGSSVWQLQSAASRRLLGKVIDKCRAFYLREGVSEVYVKQSIPVESMEVVKRAKDLSFYYLAAQRKKYLSNNVRRNIVGFTIVGEREIASKKEYNNYIKELAAAMAQVAKLGFQISVVPQVVYSQEPYFKELSLLKNRLPTVEIIQPDLDGSVEALLKYYSSISILVASRMHSAIYALSMDTPVFPIAYDSGAKWAILEEFGIDPVSVPTVGNVRADAIVDFVKNRCKSELNNKLVLAAAAQSLTKVFKSDLAGVV